MAANHISKKACGVKSWLVLDSRGETQVVESNKQWIMRRTGLPACDLRILDPLMSYPSTIYGRGRAIVINLEHLKAIITAHHVFLLNSRDPTVVPTVIELRKRISTHYHAQERNEESLSRSNSYHTEVQSQSCTAQNNSGGLSQFDQEEEENADSKQGLESRDRSNIIPFEFIALEACLEAACTSLENEARTLELEAHPALEKLISKISTLNLERVRQIKSRLVAITGRVRKIRDELERLLDDDEDMAEMYLSEKLMQQEDYSSTSFVNERDGIDDEVLRSDLNERDTAEIPLPGTSQFDNLNGHLFGATTVLSRGSHDTHRYVDELEMLLEAYFVQIDGTLNKLSALREFVDDTEDYINIMLDDKQNHLLQMGVMLTIAALVLSAFVAVTGTFSMNININLYDEKHSGNPKFLFIIGCGTAGSIFSYVVAIAWCKRKHLL